MSSPEIPQPETGARAALNFLHTEAPATPDQLHKDWETIHGTEAPAQSGVGKLLARLPEGFQQGVAPTTELELREPAAALPAIETVQPVTPQPMAGNMMGMTANVWSGYPTPEDERPLYVEPRVKVDPQALEDPLEKLGTPAETPAFDALAEQVIAHANSKGLNQFDQQAAAGLARYVRSVKEKQAPLALEAAPVSERPALPVRTRGAALTPASSEATAVSVIPARTESPYGTGSEGRHPLGLVAIPEASPAQVLPQTQTHRVVLGSERRITTAPQGIDLGALGLRGAVPIQPPHQA